MMCEILLSIYCYIVCWLNLQVKFVKIVILTKILCLILTFYPNHD